MSIERVSGASGVEAWLVEDHSIPIVTLAFAFAGGAALDPVGKEGTASMAAALFDEGAGTTTAPPISAGSASLPASWSLAPGRMN